ncbi:MAG: hypothetical protein A2496_23795 [Burkholderiales bacterium RIFOXYC12_FULL_60_6]|nr:MAG: hypothetical protein A2503_14720 [Burkholderiales bacterium RIFOXYD12_FULL_59_19]OGB76337.1 MAG: hypothetical protein A2496_23795 [Burkholderiales bacterium RIFOXYC12_FULL_60_6]
MKQNHSGKPNMRIALLASAALLGLVSHNVWAVVTPSGTVISNIATMNYSVGGVAQTPIGSSPTGNTSGAGTATAFVVDNKVNLTVAESNSTVTSVSPGATNQVTTFTVTNTGNTAQGYTLVGANAIGAPTVFTVADDLDATVSAVFVDANGNSTYDEATDTLSAISSLAPGASVSVFVLATIPAAATNGQQAVVTLSATTKTAVTMAAVAEPGGANTASVDIVFADSANALTDPLAANTARDAIGIAQDAYRVVSSVLSVTKTGTVLCDPLNGITTPKNIPGAIVQYTVLVSNAAGTGASATLTTVTDTLAATVTHDPGLRVPTDAASCIAGTSSSGFKIVSSVVGRTLGGAAGVMTNIADADGATIVGQGLTVTFATALPAGGGYTAGELKSGESATITYNVIIN